MAVSALRVGGARVGGVEHICVELALEGVPECCSGARARRETRRRWWWGPCVPTHTLTKPCARSERACLQRPSQRLHTARFRRRARSRVANGGGVVTASPPMATRAWRGSALTGLASTGQLSAQAAAVCPLCTTAPTPRALEHICRSLLKACQRVAQALEHEGNGGAAGARDAGACQAKATAAHHVRASESVCTLSFGLLTTASYNLLYSCMPSDGCPSFEHRGESALELQMHTSFRSL